MFFDVCPLGLNKKKELFLPYNKRAVAICSQEASIISGLRDILRKCIKTTLGIVWIRADEKTIERIAKNIHVIYAQKSESMGLFRFSLPEIAFNLDESGIDLLTKEFDQLSSMEVYIIDESNFNNTIEHIESRKDDNIYENINKKLKYSEVIFNKSGDEDEIEIVMNKKHTIDILNAFVSF